jgi:hypothetical protein
MILIDGHSVFFFNALALMFDGQETFFGGGDVWIIATRNTKNCNVAFAFVWRDDDDF